MNAQTLTPTERAARIAELTSAAADAAAQLERTVAEALKLAEDDYEYNDERLRSISGALRLASGALSVEGSTWRTYASERARNEDRRNSNAGY